MDSKQEDAGEPTGDGQDDSLVSLLRDIKQWDIENSIDNLKAGKIFKMILPEHLRAKIEAALQRSSDSGSSLNDSLCGKIGKIDKYRSKSSRVNDDYDMVRITIDLNLPEDYKLYRIFKQIKNA